MYGFIDNLLNNVAVHILCHESIDRYAVEVYIERFQFVAQVQNCEYLVRNILY